jgi:hypothetical protein
MPRRLARILTALALVVGFGAGISSGPADAAPAAGRSGAIISDVDWWW